MKTDIYRIEPKIPYSTKHSDLVNIAKEEKNNEDMPKIKSIINDFSEYDIIYVGYPIWWGDMPRILYTFFSSYDFTGKVVIPFFIHGGSGLAQTVSTIKNMLDSAIVIEDAFTISRNNMEDAPIEVKLWLDKINNK